MPHVIKTRVHTMAIAVIAVAMIALGGCLGGTGVDDERAAEFEKVVDTWSLEIEALTIELANVRDEATGFGSLVAIRGHVSELQDAIQPLGEMDDNDASY
jgi:hypothetical protein